MAIKPKAIPQQTNYNGLMHGDRALPQLAASASASNLVHAIGREIVSGGYEPNSRLPDEDSMRDRYTISRTALREAYSKLMAKGLLAARPKVGTTVRPRAHWNMLDTDVLSWHLQTLPAEEIASDLYALRRMIEPGAAELAAELHTPEDMAGIDTAFRDMNMNSSSEPKLVEADFRFHMAILNATKNPFINAFSGLIHAAMISTFEISWRGAEEIREERLGQHGDVAEAIRQREPALARQRMEKLLDDSINDVKEVLSKE